MKIYYDINEYAADIARSGSCSAVALGYFDGVHEGHRAVISAALDNKGGASAVVLTFSESPAAALGHDVPDALTDNAAKAAVIARMGVDAVILADFREIKDMSAEDFVRVILKEKLRANSVFCGFNYRFGRGGSGDTDVLVGCCAAVGIEARVVEPVYIDGAPVSSTRIRALLARGDVAGAGRLLGRGYSISGTITGGNRIGRSMGLPTVNIPIEKGMCVPRLGVYSSLIHIAGKTYPGATNIGVHPTVGDSLRPLCETFILGFDGSDVYESEAVCELRSFIRPEKRFASLDELKAQIKRDIQAVEKEII